jgi:hypothetical protein
MPIRPALAKVVLPLGIAGEQIVRQPHTGLVSPRHRCSKGVGSLVSQQINRRNSNNHGANLQKYLKKNLNPVK